MMSKIKILLFTLLLVSNSISARGEVNVESNQEDGSYVINGDILLDDTFNGTDETQAQSNDCPGCAWLVSSLCFSFEPDKLSSLCFIPGSCKTIENIDGVRKRVWRKLGVDQPWLEVGSMCVGPKGPLTPKKLLTSISEQAVEYLPRLIPTTQPVNDVLVNVDVYFLSNQSNYFGPKTVVITGIPVTLTATSSWVWNFSDGTSISTSNSGFGFPDGQVKHKFDSKGLHTISVTTTWNATWKTNSKISIPVPGKSLTQTTLFTLNAHEARGILTR